MICWMFPGQPVAFTEMPAEDADFRSVASLCHDVTGYSPLETTEKASLSHSVKLQLFGVCMSLYKSGLLARQGIQPDIIAEHSMGIYPALAASGSIDNATALELVCRLGSVMMEMSAGHSYALGSVVGLTAGVINSVSANNGVHIANYNTSRHFLLAGERSCMELALAEAEACGAFSVGMFLCDAPLHTPLIDEIAGTLRDVVSGYSFGQPKIRLLEHCSQTDLTAASIPGFLVDELCTPVQWEATYRILKEQQTGRFFEPGIGSSLSKFNRWIDSET